ncbi:hypothetical protein COY07_05070 [Candidatus Peregrinibacteria bacterium CG_4_10_14_0_2_um_filter_43_11]|nr:MAG: hypothetical protein COY07_05070 [Candidatus Peregrinibacteria bacterium CG_4_10_14_0_2_um_filter_43_11]
MSDGHGLVRETISGIQKDLHGEGVFAGYTYEFDEEDYEVVSEWKEGVDKLIEEVKTSIQSKSPEDPLYKMIHKESGEFPAEKDITLFAIGTFIRRKKARWPGKIMAALKLTMPGRKHVKDFGQGIDICMDLAIVAHILAGLYRYKGTIKKMKTLKAHHYWQEVTDEGEEGSIIDVDFCLDTNGYVKDPSQHKERAKRRYAVYRELRAEKRKNEE